MIAAFVCRDNKCTVLESNLGIARAGSEDIGDVSRSLVKVVAGEDVRLEESDRIDRGSNKWDP